MLGKRFVYKRGVMIALAVVALMTLTAGAAMAHGNSAKQIAAIGYVDTVGLGPGGTVGSEFNIKKNGDIRSVNIATDGEIVSGAITELTKCKENKHSEGACAHVGAILTGSGILSIHSSEAKLRVTEQEHLYHPTAPIPVISGKLKGNLGASLTVFGANGEVLSGQAALRIRGTEPASSYGCLVGIEMDGVTPIWSVIQTCIDSPGPNALGLVVGPGVWVIPDGEGGVLPLPNGGPIMVPVELHVFDKGKFEVASDVTELTGKIQVTVDSSPLGTAGSIEISRGKAHFAGDHDHSTD